MFLGLVLFTLPHLWKHFAPEQRARAGQAGRGAVGLIVLLGLVLIVWGYRGWDDAGQAWFPAPWLTHLNNLLMLVAVYLFAVSGMKTRAHRWTRHPMLIGVALWAASHLIVNGDWASVWLFGALLAWSFFAIGMVNLREPAWTPPPPAPWGKEAGAVVGTVVVFAAIGWIHAWLGVWPFPA
jgi:uncharacterized membrane protein